MVDEAQQYAKQAVSINTQRAYQADWRDFSAWCEFNGLASLPADSATVALYLTFKARTLSIATLSRRLTAISSAHKLSGFTTPCDDERVKAIWKGIRRSKGVARNGKAPLLAKDLKHYCETSPTSLDSVRDRALVMLGFVGALRRSELVALDRADVAFVEEGLVLRIKRSKTDQEAKGSDKAIPYASDPNLCPVRALRAWLEVSPEVLGPLFVSIGKGSKLHDTRLSDKSVSLIVKKIAKSLKKDIDAYSGHSLRSGFVTQAAINGASDRAIMKQTQHKSRAMVDHYVRIATIWQDNAATQLGL